MKRRENDQDYQNVKFNENEITLAATLLDKLTNSMEIVYYCMEHGEKSSIVIMLVSAEKVDLETLLKIQKRDTDILIEIDKSNSLYALIFQDTRIDGGYHFAERLIETVNGLNAHEIYCSSVEVQSTRNDKRYIIFTLAEMFVKSKRENRSGEIIFKSLN